jgi:hypothetical protein
MASHLREVAQIPARIRYLYTVTGTNAWVPNAGTQFNSILPATAFGTQYSAITDISGSSYLRDMGRTLTLVDSNGLHVATLRLVQTVAGATTEGVPDNWNTIGQYYVSTWSADPLSVYNPTVVRSG